MLDLYRPGSHLSLRKCGVLISFLPPESATATEMRNSAPETVDHGFDEPDAAENPWAMSELLIASVVDEIRWLRHEFRSANSKQPGPPPTQVPRPGVKATKRRARYTLEQARLLDPRMREG